MAINHKANYNGVGVFASGTDYSVDNVVVEAGDLILYSPSWEEGGTSDTSEVAVTDSEGNTYIEVGYASTPSSTNFKVGLFFAQAATSATLTITGTGDAARLTRASHAAVFSTGGTISLEEWLEDGVDPASSDPVNFEIGPFTPAIGELLYGVPRVFRLVDAYTPDPGWSGDFYYRSANCFQVATSTASTNIAGELDLPFGSPWWGIGARFSEAASGVDVVTNPDLENSDSDFDVTFTPDVITDPELENSDSDFTAEQVFDALTDPELEDSDSDFVAGHQVDVFFNQTLENSDSDFVGNQTFDGIINPELGGSDSNFIAGSEVDVVFSQTLENADSDFVAEQVFDALVNPVLGDADSVFNVTLSFDGLINPELEDSNSNFLAGHSLLIDVLLNPDLEDSTSDFTAQQVFDAVINPELGNSVSDYTAGPEVDAILSQTLENSNSNFTANHLVNVLLNPRLEDSQSDTQVQFSFDAVINVTLGNARSDFNAFQLLPISLTGEIQSQSATFSGNIISSAREESLRGEIISGPASIEGVILAPGVPQDPRQGLILSIDRYVDIETEEFDGQQ